MYCGSQTIAIASAGKARAFPLRCRSWSCATCAPDRRRRLIRECKSGEPNRFVTLTVNPYWFESPAERGRELAKAWRDYVREYRRQHPNRELHYMAVLELTKRGEPHLHIICRSTWIAQKHLSRFMEQRMGAPIVDVRMVRGAAETARYVSKYVSKRPIKLGTMKRYWRSQAYIDPEIQRQKKLRKAGRSVWIIELTHSEFMAAIKRNQPIIYQDWPGDEWWRLHPFETTFPVPRDYQRKIK